MERIKDFLIVALIGILLLLLQQSALVSFLGIRADFVLLFFVFCATTRRRFYEYIILLGLLLLFSFFTAEVWFFNFIFFCILALLLYVLRSRLPGRFFFDFFILVVLGTAGMFFGMPVFQEFITHGFDFSELSFPLYNNLFLELLLNILFGFVFIFLGTRRFLIKIFS